MTCGHYIPVAKERPSMVEKEDHPELAKMQTEIDLASIGAQGFRIMKGALDEGASLMQAMLVLAAWFKAVGTADLPEDED